MEKSKGNTHKRLTPAYHTEQSGRPEIQQIPGEKTFIAPVNDDIYFAHLSGIVEYSDDAIISKSLDGTIRSWNKGSEKMFGYSSQDAVGKNISMIVPRERFEEEAKIYDRIRHNEIIEIMVRG